MRPPRIPRCIPTRRFALALALLAPVWLLSFAAPGLAVALALTGLLVAGAVWDAWQTPGGSELVVERDLPRTVGVGATAAGAYRVRSARRGPARRPLDVTLYDTLPAGLAPGVAPTGANARVGREGIRIPIDVTGRVRGSYALGPVVLRVGGPLGLAQRTLRYPLDGTITVTPSIAGLRRYRLLSMQHRLRDAGVRTLRRRGEGTSFTNLREYVVGDDPRYIDWKATARRDRLITREFAVERGQTVLIAVDAGRMMTQLAGAVPRFEYALSSAMVLADVALQSNDQVGLVVFDDAVRAFVPAMRGAAALQRLRDALVPVAPRMVEPDYATAFRLLAARHRKRSLIVLFTDVIDARASQALIAYTARSAARHLPLVVALRNDTLVDAAIPPTSASTDRLYESAAAEELLLARHEALLRMRNAGVTALDVSPHAMTAAVVNRYLEIKGRGAL